METVVAAAIPARRRSRSFLALCTLAGILFAVGGLPAVVAAAQTKAKAPEPLDLNTATVEQLERLPGIGPATAKAIVRFREKSGPFRRVEDLLAIRGITKKRLEKIRPYVTVKLKSSTP